MNFEDIRFSKWKSDDILKCSREEQEKDLIHWQFPEDDIEETEKNFTSMWINNKNRNIFEYCPKSPVKICSYDKSHTYK